MDCRRRVIDRFTDFLDKNKNKRRYWWLWVIWIALFFIIEVYAIVTGEKDVPTLSRTWWWLRDRWKVVVPSIVMGFFLIWLWFHFVLGECALGLC